MTDKILHALVKYSIGSLLVVFWIVLVDNGVLWLNDILDRFDSRPLVYELLSKMIVGILFVIALSLPLITMAYVLISETAKLIAKRYRKVKS